jgi:type IV pilus assembly protein PilO
MPRSFSLNLKDPRVAARLVVGTLALANVAAALVAFHPWGGSAEDLRREQQDVRRQLADLQARIVRTRALTSKVAQARKEGEGFLGQYVNDRRSASSAILDELQRTAKEAGITAKSQTANFEPVEGSDTLSQMTISAAYEGTYANLIKFVNLLDKSKRFLIIENLSATPQQTGATLNVSLKLDTFVRDEAGSAT